MLNIQSGNFKKSLNYELSYIRRAYEKALKEQTSSPLIEWLCDNYYILEREGRSVLKELKTTQTLPMGDDKKPVLFHLCEETCQGGVLPAQNDLIQFFLACGVKGCEAEALHLMLRYTLLHIACEGCKKGGDEGTKLLGSAIKSFRNIQDIDFNEVLEQTSTVEKILDEDPEGVYSCMDEQTRALYRRQISKSSHKHGVSEEQEARDVLELARNGSDYLSRHVGKYIMPVAAHKKRGKIFLLLEIAIPAVAAALLGFAFKSWYIAPLLFFPLWEALRSVIEAISLSKVPPQPLPRLELNGNVPESAQTLITVSTLLPSTEKSAELKKRLLELWLSNGQKSIKICLLADLKGADTPEKPEDNAAIAAAKRVVEELNKKYSGGFILAVRPRVFSPTQGSFTGLERKRGAITDLIRAIKGEKAEFICIFGDVASLGRTRYILALDSDTFLPMDIATELISVALHPLNIPQIDAERGLVTSGYGVLVPRVETDLAGAGASSFAKIMAGGGGITAYDSFASERYQDLFGEGIFSGKGLIEVNSFHTLLKDVFPQEQILSHDILEGSFLRTGFVSDMQAADGFPKRQGAYLDRLNRWIRGDWQNAEFIFKKSPLSALSRYKLFDNLRRSLNPIIACTGIILSVFMPLPEAVTTVIICLLGAAGGSFFAAMRSTLAGGPSMFSRLYYSGAMPAALASFVRGFVAILMLPQTAYVCLDAIARALWRLLISKKNLLEWTTAAQVDKAQKVSAMILRYIPSLTVGAVLIAFGDSLQRLCGILFIFNLPFAMLSGKENQTNTHRFDYLSREKLSSYAAAMWRYFEELCTEENNFLPPDNMQETPVHIVAHRTSPTNIGLMLLCTLAARDFGFIGSPELYSRLNASISSIEKLAKWRGNLLNWYNTLNLKPLEPKYVSTVDSGNFLCCLVALKQGLREYLGECSELKLIIERITSLINACDIASLYNPRRKLFHIGYDISTNDFSSSYYDLLMSEARMTGYYAIAGRAVPKKHWGALGRTLARAGRYTGPVSWTGTMFEYFMPYIFLPEPEGSLNFEALRFCLWCQRRRTHTKKISGQTIPWGISESGFYAFDRQLNYQYKAHGVQKLGLKRGLNSELVISPYSTFLALSLEPRDAIRNLKALEGMEMVGRCGFYEAADFTSTRTGGQDYAVVRSYMAHHVGMSMLCVLNALKDNLIQRRFMSDDTMAAAVCLLQEKIPSGAVVFKDVELREVPKTRERTEPQVREFEVITPTAPHMKLLTNGEWTLGITDVGASVSLYRGANITRHSFDLLRRPSGIFAYIRAGNNVLPIVSAIDYGTDAQIGVEFEEKRTIHSAKKKNLSAKMITSVHPRLPCEQRRFIVKNHSSKETLNGNLYIYLEPSLARYAEDVEHPAFSKLFLTSEYNETNRLLLFTRRPRSGNNTLCLAVGITENLVFTYETSREKILTCGYGLPSLLWNEGDFTNGSNSPDSCAAFCVPLKIPPKGRSELTLVMCAASTKSEAINHFIKVREEGILPAEKGAPGPFAEGGLEGIIADNILPLIYYYAREVKESLDSKKLNTMGKHALWGFGISGDNPIIFIDVHNPEDVARCIPYIRLNKKLRYSGIAIDVAIAFKDGGEYDTPILTAIRGALKKEGCENYLGVNGGIHSIDLTLRNNNELTALKAAACFIAPVSAERFELPLTEYKPVKILASEPDGMEENNGYTVNGGSFTDGKFTIPKTSVIPSVPWSFVLSNHEFGTMVSDKALGYTWAVNSRENKLTPWYNDTRSDNRGELLLVKIEGKIYDLLLGARAEFSKSYARWFGNACGLKYEVAVSVPQSGMVKNCEIKIKNTAEHDSKVVVVYYTEPVMGINRGTARFIKAETNPDGIVLNSPWSELQGYMTLKVSGGADFICCDRADFLTGNWSAKHLLPLQDPCAAVGKTLNMPANSESELTFSLSWGRVESAAESLGGLEEEPLIRENSIKIKTPDDALNHMFNTFLPLQIINSRFYGRTGFYQCGGAWGFRDQLQDASALVLLMPQLVRRHIMRCASVQFEQGDVLHWWHDLPNQAGGLRGVRTRYSDDLLWLPFITAEYVKKTGDFDLLNVKAPYITGDELREDEHERYFQPVLSEKRGTIYEHCIRSIERSMRFGEHGLPLIGGGDWNDGFNLVGAGGRGESVWLAQFMALVVENMAPFCKLMDEQWRAADYQKLARRLKMDIDERAWANDRYLRAFYDDGSAMGGAQAIECEIDSLPQSFSILCDMPNMERRKQAVDSVLRELVDEKHGIIKLFNPPFTGKGKNPGYVSAYPPGIRENGGQYTHAAIWLCIALIRDGRADEGYKLLKMLNPASFCQNSDRAQIYRAEPYALAGDVYAAPGIEGQAGWSLYTGAAAWYYRAVYEELLGIQQRDGSLYIEPNLPESWDGYEAEIEVNGGIIKLCVKKTAGRKLIVDGKPAEAIPLDGKNHEATMI